MNAWPMIARCLERQWWGYTPVERGGIDYAWDHGQSAPGLIGGLGRCVMYPIWTLQGVSGGQGDLISLKEDYWDDPSG